jgi:hypothetical protein
MSLTRIFGSPKGIGSELTSSEINDIDANIENALDKTSGASDTLESQVTITGAGDLIVGAGTTIDANTATSVIKASASGAKIIATGAGAKIRTESGGRIELADSDWPTFSATRTRNVPFPAMPSIYETTKFSVSATASGAPYINSASSGPGGVFWEEVPPHNGANLASLTMYWRAVAMHLALPAVFPSIEVFRVTTNSVNTMASLHSGGAAFYSTGLLATYNDGAIKSITFTPNQNATIDTSQYHYLVKMTDESGANAINGNIYYSFLAVYNTISDMRFT